MSRKIVSRLAPGALALLLALTAFVSPNAQTTIADVPDPPPQSSSPADSGIIAEFMDLENKRNVAFEDIRRMTGDNGYTAALTRDPHLPTCWAGNFPIAGVYGESGWIVMAAVQYNDQLIMAGEFQWAHNIQTYNIVAWDGSSWSDLNVGCNAPVSDVAVYNGDLYACGLFDIAGSATVNGIARWDGSNWHPVGGGANSIVWELEVHNGELLAAGYFTSIGGVTANGIAAWDGSSWSDFNAGFDDATLAMTIHDNTLYAGGLFTESDDGTAMNRVAYWHESSAEWRPLNDDPGTGVNNDVYDMTTWDDRVVACGEFTEIFRPTGLTAGYIMAYEPATGDFYSLSGGMDNTVFGVGTYNDRLFAGGEFDLAGGAIIRFVAARDPGDVYWEPVDADDFLIRPVNVYNFAQYYDELIMVGEMLQVGYDFDEDRFENEFPAYGMVRWDGSDYRPVSLGLAGSARDFVEYDGELIVAGLSKSFADGTTGHGILSWNGTSWSRLGNGVDYRIYALEVFNGDLYAAGDFDEVGETDANNIARWNGTSWSVLDDGLEDPGSNARVNDLTVFDGNLMVGGSFSQAGGNAANNTCRWTGSSWAPFGPGFNEPVLALHAFDGELYAGGRFDLNYDRIARWDPTGGGSWDNVSGGIPSGWVTAMTTFNGDLIVAGWFGNAGGTIVDNIARWDGSSFWPLAGTDLDSTSSALLEVDGELVAGGIFDDAQAMPVDYLATYDGSAWSGLGELNDRVYALYEWNNELYIGGRFRLSESGTVLAPGFTVLSPDFDGDGFCAAADNCPSLFNDMQIDSNGDGVGDVCSNTSPGGMVALSLGWINLQFTTVNTLGHTTVDTADIGPPLPAGYTYALGEETRFFDISSSADYDGDIQLTFTYDPSELVGDASSLSILHYDTATGSWNDITTGVFPGNSQVTGPAPCLSPFTLALSACCSGQTGNVNNDPGGQVDLPDVIFLVNALFLGGDQPECPAAANIDGDQQCNVDLPDVIALVNALFLGGNPPAPCLSQCQ
ncbi:hypothetical protein GF420_02980 [candidate division GN15 bacterium]|nr:hypothetical protein [candidate division GN15 bacterium]